LNDYRKDLPLEPEETLRVVSRASELWGAKWRREGSGGHLELPVTAGVRRGVLRGRLWIEPTTEGSSIVLRIEQSHYQIHWGAVIILLFGAAGALTATLWPFYPPLLGLAPLAIVLALAAWFLVASRLRTSTPEDFLELVAMAHAEEATAEPTVEEPESPATPSRPIEP
jgi:hypothetical protein